MFDEIYCDATLPDGRDPRGTCFQTKSLPDPCMCRYRITSAGRLIDSAGNDLEPDGYIFIRSTERTATAKRRERLRSCGSIALGSCPDSFKISCALTKTALQASVTGWLRFDGSSRVRFSLAIRMKYPIPARMTRDWKNRSRAGGLFSPLASTFRKPNRSSGAASSRAPIP